MSSPAQIAANQLNALSSTGPRTEEGKANSSRNSVRHGLFTQGDHVCPGEETSYQELIDSLQTELTPEGTLETSLVAEIRRATWRLERCAVAEGDLIDELAAGSDSSGSISSLDTFRNEAFARLQTAIDRARAQAHRLLHKSTLELRRLQTERQYRREVFREGTDNSFLGICDFRSVMKGIAERDLMEVRERKLTEDNLTAMLRQRDLEFFQMKDRTQSARPESVPFTERTQFAHAETAPIAERTQSATAACADLIPNAA
jgi:hypothetical protein